MKRSPRVARRPRTDGVRSQVEPPSQDLMKCMQAECNRMDNDNSGELDVKAELKGLADSPVEDLPVSRQVRYENSERGPQNSTPALFAALTT
jgi:hypothetical protein